MSALGQKQTLERIQSLSALPPKADMDHHGRDVRFVPIADMALTASRSLVPSDQPTLCGADTRCPEAADNSAADLTIDDDVFATQRSSSRASGPKTPIDPATLLV
jgi:hypothetical protein